jgi:hypothetical protein
MSQSVYLAALLSGDVPFAVVAAVLAARFFSNLDRSTAKLRDPDLHCFTTFTLARGIDFWQGLRLVWRSRWLQASFDEIIRSGDASERLARHRFFGFREQAIPDGNISCDFLDSVFPIDPSIF